MDLSRPSGSGNCYFFDLVRLEYFVYGMEADFLISKLESEGGIFLELYLRVNYPNGSLCGKGFT